MDSSPQQQSPSALELEKAVVRSALNFKDVYGNAWLLLKERWRDFAKLVLAMTGLLVTILLGCAILFAILTFVGAGLGPAKIVTTGLTVIVAMVAAAALLLSIFVGAVADSRIFFEERVGEKFWWSILKSSAPTWHRYAWVSILQSLTASGGSFALKVGQLIVSTRCTFSIFLLIEKDKRGLDALVGSDALVRGKGFRVFMIIYLPALLAAIAFFITILVLAALLKGLAVFILPIIYAAALLVFVPLMLCVHVVIYKKLKTLPLHTDPNPKRTRTAYVVLAILGILSIPLSAATAYNQSRTSNWAHAAAITQPR